MTSLGYKHSAVTCEPDPSGSQQCQLCGSQATEPLYETRDRHYGIRGAFSIVRCLQCGLVFLSRIPSAQELAKLYPADYYAYQDDTFGPEINRTEQRLRSLLGLPIHTIEPDFAEPGRMLDIGCGVGAFLLETRNRGWDTRGVEINPDAAKLGCDRHGLDIFCGTIEDAKYETSSFDYIRSNHSFEHISDPNSTLAEVRRLLKPTGTC